MGGKRKIGEKGVQKIDDFKNDPIDPDEDRCGNCFCFEINPGSVKDGLCHKSLFSFPVQIKQNTYQVKSLFPPAKSNDWCSSHLRGTYKKPAGGKLKI